MHIEVIDIVERCRRIAKLCRVADRSVVRVANAGAAAAIDQLADDITWLATRIRANIGAEAVA